MATAVRPDAPSALSPERFHEIMELVRTRSSDPAAQAAIESDPDIAPAWRSFLQAAARILSAANANARSFRRPEEFRTRAFSRSLRAGSGRYWSPRQDNQLYTPELAIVLGEINRASRIPVETRGTERLGQAAFEPNVRAMLGDEADLEYLYPLLALASDAFFRHRRPKLTADDRGLPLPMALDAVKALQQLQASIDFKERKIAKLNLGQTLIPHMAAHFADEQMLSSAMLPEAFQAAYDSHWHTATKTKSATGGFVYELRDRAQRTAAEELLVVLAASSDGRNRAVSGGATHTPSPVYDKMIYDNSLGVLQQVVQNAQFNNYKAFAMLDTTLAPQTIAVMKHGRVDMNVRVMGCERAIAHEGVDPIHVYEFLRDHVRDEGVPHALWHSFILELHRRLNVVRVHGTPKQVDLFEGRVQRFTALFVDECLMPYWKARKELKDAEAAGRQYTSPYLQRQIRANREFIGAHEFIQDGELLDILLEGIHHTKDLIQLLRYCVEAEIPLTDKMLLKVFTHEDQQVREAGMELLPHMDEAKVQELATTVKARVAADYAAVRDVVFSNVIPEYEPIEGVARELSRMHHYFEAAKEIAKEDLIATFVRCAEKDPRTIPEAFQELTSRKRSAARIEAMLGDEATTDAPDAALEPTMRDGAESVDWTAFHQAQQGDLFGPGPAAKTTPTRDSERVRGSGTVASRRKA